MAEEKKEEAPATEPEGGDEADAVKKKGAGGAGGGPNPKLILIVLVLNAVVLIVLALVVWKSYVSSSSQVSLSDVAADKDGAKPHGEGGEHGGEHGGGEHGEKKEGKKEGEAADNYINESFTVNLADSKGAHFVKVDVAIEVEDANVKDEVKRLRPKIRDFINVILSSKNYEQVESSDGRAFLREEIRNKINGYLSRGQIKDVYFTQFVFQ